ncbi:hypothetical protein T265_01088 [Opisthorchis viverrini]|uniref:Uncharacterized protein n=1 Tax=Opisthorchis viverrini TaxID=6198 RepID=A0A075AJ97_OPIVI|nr:hypothetical protein T265_01088 [Opisthorchis viverrini]KER33004.1 hypothetical protein T265_01088 [Opisthorchis viverrini]
MRQSKITATRGISYGGAYEASNKLIRQHKQQRKITLPYIRKVAEMTERHLRQHGIAVAFRPTNTLRTLSKPKGVTPINSQLLYGADTPDDIASAFFITTAEY